MADVHTLLLDADGVLQWPTPGWLEKWRPFARGDLEGFMAEMFAVELPALRGEEPLQESVERFLRETGRDPGAVDEICSPWRMIDLFEPAFDLIAQIRAAGVEVYLASNQQQFRRDVMLDLGYADHFDGLFFSCDLGVAKPDPDYFRAILRELDRGPEGVVFIDDRHDNVAAAATVGISAHHHDVHDSHAEDEFGIANLTSVLRSAGVPGV